MDTERGPGQTVRDVAFSAVLVGLLVAGIWLASRSEWLMTPVAGGTAPRAYALGLALAMTTLVAWLAAGRFRHLLRRGRAGAALRPETLAEAAPDLLRLAWAPQTPPGTVVETAAFLARGDAEAVLFGRPWPAVFLGDPAERLAAAEHLLAHAERRLPGHHLTGAALGVVRLAGGRLEDARDLLDIGLRDEPPALVASVLAVQAVVAAELGAREEALDRLAAARAAGARLRDPFVAATLRDAAAWVEG